VWHRLTIVAFGDSLTVGYLSPTGEEEWPQPIPYTRFLRRKTENFLRNSGRSDLEVEFLNRGIVGELTADMVDRFGRDVIEIQPGAVIILGGSNDLGWGMEPLSVVTNLKTMYDEALRNGIRPVSCTVPSVRGFDDGIRPRLQLNDLIKKCSGDRGIVCVDVFAATGDPAGRLKAEYSNDGLHLNAAGYEVMADAMFSDAVGTMISDWFQR